ncbi:MAG: type III secretion system export apparatus subunit SctR [Enterobacteriaceae bacterium]
MAFIDHPMQLIAVLFLLSILPLLAVMGTSFLKIAIVFSILRNALGIQQIPPNMAIYGLALIMTLFIMAPVGMKIGDNLQAAPISLSSPDFVQQVNSKALEPYRDFLRKNSSKTKIKFFSEIGHKVWPQSYTEQLNKDSLIVMIPAFTMTQLDEAFKIGLLLYLPFVAIDLIVSNILLAMGMMMVSPMTISLPFKILVFVLINGWDRLISQLLMSFS